MGIVELIKDLKRLLRWFLVILATLLGIIMTGIKWQVLDNFAIFSPNHIFPGR